MRGHAFIDHTADIGIKVWADSRDYLFEEAASAMLSIIVDCETIQPLINKKVRVVAESNEMLFLKWLKEILFILEKFSLVFKTCRILEIKSFNQTKKKLVLTGILSGTIAVVFGTLFLVQTFRHMKNCNYNTALSIMYFSFLYLPVVQIAYLIDKI